MNYLLDTHVLIWLTQDLPHLGKKSRQILKTAPKLFFSPLSIAELQVKSAKGKLKFEQNFVASLVQAGITELPFTSYHAHSVSRFPALINHDPLDRMILAQAATEQINLMSADQKFLDLQLSWIVDAHE